MKRILLTGATGFIGQHCLRLLASETDEIHALAFTARETYIPGVTWHRADLLEAGQSGKLLALVRPTHLLHLAWFAVPGKYWSSLENLSWLAASVHLLKEFVEHDGQRAVIAGTCAEYDWQNGLCSEYQTSLSPDSLYGTCKNALQQVLAAVAEKKLLSAAWGRIFQVYGPGEHRARLIPSVIGTLMEGKNARCSEGSQIRDFIHVEDVAGALVALLYSDISGPVNIASGHPVPVKDVVQRIARILESETLVQFGSLGKATEEPPFVVADVTRLRQELRWEPSLDLGAGLEKTIAWHKSRLVNC